MDSRKRNLSQKEKFVKPDSNYKQAIFRIAKTILHARTHTHKRAYSVHYCLIQSQRVFGCEQANGTETPESGGRGGEQFAVRTN